MRRRKMLSNQSNRAAPEGSLLNFLKCDCESSVNQLCFWEEFLTSAQEQIWAKGN